MAVAETVRHGLKDPGRAARSIWQKPLFRDRLFIGFLVVAVVLSLIVVVSILIKVRPKDFVVPLQYSTLEGFDGLGSWYRVYLYGLFSIMVTVANIILALYCYPKSRITSFFLVLGTVVINIFTTVIVLTLLTHLNS